MTPLSSVLSAAPSDLITVGGLPLHPLAVHAVVVLLPLSVLGLIAIIARPQWRKPYANLVMLGLAAGTGATVVAVKAGEQLATITGISEEHRTLGKLLGIDAVALLIFALAWYWAQRQPSARASRSVLGTGVQALAALGSIALGVASLLLSALVGHSGATAVWQSKLAPAPAPSSSVAAGTAYTMTQVAKHSSNSSCWSTIDGKVYDLTGWINKHPGGPGVIEGLCGHDGSAAFTAQHGGASRPAQYLADYRIGKLKGSSSGGSTAKPDNSLTKAGVATHNTSSSCWTIINGKVYDLTQWISLHPGGPGVIQGLCGIDGSAAFMGQHGNQGEPNQQLSTYLLGALKG